MTCTDIVKIIQACGDAGVHSFMYNGMEVLFNNGPLKLTPAEIEDMPHLDTDLPIDQGNTLGYNSELEDDNAEEIDGIPVDQAIDELKFTDPEAWDELAKAGEV